MALITAEFRSKALSHDTKITVILPEDCPRDNIPTLYLLHGMHGNNSSWARKTLIERYAGEHGIAVVCPDGENSFYNDMRYGKKFYTYISDELVDYTRRVFRLSTEREKTYICGLSMGGYGAIRTALMKPEQYAAAASLSGCLDILARLKKCPWPAEARSIWGDDYYDYAKGTDVDIMWLVDHFPSDKPKPRLYAACGTEDSLYTDNITFRDFMKDKDFDFKFEDGSGVHNWEFWNTWVKVAMDHMLSGAAAK